MTRFRTLGLALVMLAPAVKGASAQPAFLINRGVQDEIKVTAEQAMKLKSIAGDLMKTVGADSAKLRGLPAEERSEKSREVFRRSWDEMHGRLAEVLKPEQIRRLDRIIVQNLGFTSFEVIPLVRERLKFTEGQEAKIREIREEGQRMLGPQSSIQGRAMNDPEGMRRKLDEVTKGAITKVVAVMTDEQKKTWADLTGPPFQVKFERPPAP
jgi:hypothetical protein